MSFHCLRGANHHKRSAQTILKFSRKQQLSCVPLVKRKNNSKLVDWFWIFVQIVAVFSRVKDVVAAEGGHEDV